MAEMLVALLLFLLAFAPRFSNAQTGFISIDCGIPEGTSYTDEGTGIFYTSDADYISTGENREVASSIISSQTSRQFRNVRSFPDGERNCYTLKPVIKGNKYLVRASFMYGNVDGSGMIPNFDLYLDVNRWESIAQVNATRPGPGWTEIITIAKNNFISVCLMRRRGLGNPYISALELRPIDMDMYNASTESEALVLYNRYDVGSTSGQILRYNEDPYDRIWSPYFSSSWRGLSTSFSVNTDYSFHPPNAAMRTAMTAPNATDTLYFNWTTDVQEAQFHIYRHIAEVEILGSGQLREFNACIEGYPRSCFNLFRPTYLQATTLYTITPFSGRERYSSFFLPTAQSTLPPILNAIEIYTLVKLSVVPTSELDLNAITDIRAEYGVKKNWMGDPCVPTNYTWDGIACSMNDTPRIVSLNLSFSGIEGTLISSFRNLTSLTFLDLSGNNLSGALPDILTSLPLTSLNLSGNKFNGSVPSALLERSRNGSLRLSLDGNPDLCKSDSCMPKKKSELPIAISVAAAVVGLILAVSFGLWYWKKTKTRNQKIEVTAPAVDNSNARASATSSGSFNLDNRRFTFVELANITNNFSRVLGRGGFGVVYHGQMKDGTEVAVKMLNENCSGTAEFQIEAQLLTRVYHRNLVQFVGYCADGKNLALILEYMPEGNLAQALSGSERVLSWAQRLRIGLDIAQGLEYLHVGCKPPIIHRDVKLANILLNDKFEAKIADFGLSKVFFSDDNVTHVSTAVKGTLGYLDPDYYLSNNLNEKSDVYAFGVVLMELITGKSAIIQVSESEKTSILEWVEPFTFRGDIRSIVDRRLGGDFNINSAWAALDVAIASSRAKNSQRPTMSSVVAQLKECLNVDHKVAARSRSLINYDVQDNGKSENSMFHPTPR